MKMQRYKNIFISRNNSYENTKFNKLLPYLIHSNIM